MSVVPKESLHAGRFVPTNVKDERLVRERRAKIIDAAVKLFARHGFHATTTRQIAEAAAVSVGLLYEYVGSKEDILYLVCDAIHREMIESLHAELVDGENPQTALRRAIAAYVQVCDRMQEAILLIYRETASLDAESQAEVLKNEANVTAIFEQLLEDGRQSGAFHFPDSHALELTAHNIVVLGHMWAFRRWFLRSRFTLEDYVNHQTSLLMNELTTTRE